MTFKDLGLQNALLKAIREKGYNEPTPIQEKVIPLILQGKDILASAQTGTGKTAGFALPILQKLSEIKGRRQKQIRALILAPTRELASQIHDNIKSYGKYLKIRSTVIFGGAKQGPQVSALRRGVDILVATPGRLLDLENQRKLSLKNIEHFVLDEADRMLDMGFQKDIKKILSLLPEKRQNLLFSATLSKEIKTLAKNFLHNPVTIEIERNKPPTDRITQKIIKTDKTKKRELIIKLIQEGAWKQVLVFTRTKIEADRLTKKMLAKGIKAAAIHGDKSQKIRTKTLKNFKNNSVRVLVATDVASRGLDIPLLSYVVNFELPNNPEDYVHRIGRTGRAGAKGVAISLVSNNELHYLRNIEKLLKVKMKLSTIEGFEPENSLPKNNKYYKRLKNKRSYKKKRNSNSRHYANKRRNLSN